MGKNIVLLGFMGTGKSTVGMKVAEKLKMQFVDMDREIEKLTGMSIQTLFKKYGETRFRSEEQLMATKMSNQSNLVIATGGGVVLNKDNIEALRKNGILLCLDADADIILARVNRKKGSRPLLGKNPTLGDIEKMLLEREPYYSQADYRVDTSGKEMNAIVHEIVKLIKS